MEFTTRIAPWAWPTPWPPVELPQINLMNTAIHAVDERQCVVLIIEALKRRRGGWVVTPNVDHLRRCAVDPEYARTIQNATLRVPDGMPLIWASRIQGTPLPERVAGSNLIFSLSQALAQNAMSVFLLGGEPDTAAGAGKVLTRLYPGLILAGVCCPEYGFEKNPENIWEISHQLVQARPNVVFVGLGSPKQEYLIFDLGRLLPESWWIGIGVSFSFVCGKIKRAPPWMQRCGLEWVHRLCQEPRRLARRYLIDDLPFLVRLVDRAVRNRWGGLTPSRLRRGDHQKESRTNDPSPQQSR